MQILSTGVIRYEVTVTSKAERQNIKHHDKQNSQLGIAFHGKYQPCTHPAAAGFQAKSSFGSRLAHAGSADAYAKEKKIERAHGSYESLLADPDIHVIYNSLPNHLHAEWTIKAVEAGKHVLCEKPIALNVDEVDAIKSAADKHGRVVAEAFMYRHHPQTLKVQEIVKSGSLGTLKLVRGSFSFFLDREGDVRLNPEWGGGSIWDVGCYPISYARTVVGASPLEVFGWQVTGKTGIDDTFVGQMRFKDDIQAQFELEFCHPIPCLYGDRRQ